MQSSPLLEKSPGARPRGRATFYGYENGDHGPCFGRADSLEMPVRPSTWPKWADLMPQAGQGGCVQGGARIRGHLKSGTSDRPLISYVTVVRNNRATLERTIESVQQQTYSNVEHIILDGASSDGTLDIIQRHAERLDYFASEPDAGLYDALNKAIPLARGQLICVLNSDDWLEPNAAEIAAAHMSGSRGNNLLLTAACVRDGDVVHYWQPAFVHPGSYFMCANDCHNGIYASREAYEQSGPYDCSYKIAADFKWIMKCLDAGAVFTYTKEATVNYSLGGTSSDFVKHSLECMRVVKERFSSLTPNEVAGLYHCFFVFTNATSLVGVDRPANFTTFLRELFARHGDDADFIQALSWASIVKMDHPGDRCHVPENATIRSFKEAVRDKLVGYPLMYRLARRMYVSLRKS